MLVWILTFVRMTGAWPGTRLYPEERTEWIASRRTKAEGWNWPPTTAAVIPDLIRDPLTASGKGCQRTASERASGGVGLDPDFRQDDAGKAEGVNLPPAPAAVIPDLIRDPLAAAGGKGCQQTASDCASGGVGLDPDFRQDDGGDADKRPLITLKINLSNRFPPALSFPSRHG
ncbi:MAG: hypothetical protein GC152_10530 [Alphaproteobacteria bacterium]|nr:hypothetical protein [Alphaproteobacteria bacterium]